jgi:lipopolysaccharide transport system ATP-binding protein
VPTVIKVESISKLYKLGKVSSKTIKDDLRIAWANMLGKENPFFSKGVENERTDSGGGDYVWALKDINFEVKQGEVLGIIGKNGAGKSTLLKILSRVTSPTKGRIQVKGRIASLLEVGTGFHPDLSGRENIFLNGAILGMTQREVKLKLDEIVAFSGVEKYIDTPVKRYSSGMYVRLAFAVAAHLEPEILIIDEVLAVGDAEFQKKCLGKMKDVSGQGRTVLFVSHNMGAVQNLCSSVVVMKNGKIHFPKMETSQGISHFNQMMMEKTETLLNERIDRSGSGLLRFQGLDWLDGNKKPINNPICGSDVYIQLIIKNQRVLRNVTVSIGVNNLNGDSVALFSTKLTNSPFELSAGESFLYCKIDNFPISPGMYLINLYAESDGEILDWVQESNLVEVESGDFYGTGQSIPLTHQSVCIKHIWGKNK